MGESRRQLLKILESIENSLETRAVVAFGRSPDTFVREKKLCKLGYADGSGLVEMS